jgi:hypothetical protein
MRRHVIHAVVAGLFFGAGWMAATSGLQSGVFRLSIDAPTGDTTIQCEGCEFLSWTTRGAPPERRSDFSFTCSQGPCWKVVGAVAVAQRPKQMAQGQNSK